MKYCTIVLVAVVSSTAFILCWTSSIFADVAARSSDVLSPEASIPLPNVQGRIDHFSVDIKGWRLFVAAVGNNTVEVIDVKSAKDVHSITDLAEPQGVLYDPATNRLFVACGGDGVVKIFDASTFQIVATAKLPDDADDIRYDAHSKAAVVGYAGAKQLRKRQEGSGGLAFIDSNGRRTGDVIIDAHPESFQIEERGSRIFVNVPDKKEIEVVDAAKRIVLSRWPVTAENFPMALDEAHHRLFVGCWTPPRLLVFDTETGKEVGSAEISGKTDDLFYDPSRSLIYVLTAQGFVDVIRQKDSDHCTQIARYPVPVLAQTGLFVPEWGKLFVGVPKQGAKDAEVRVFQVH